MDRIKVGVIGTGFIGPAHIEALRRLGNIDVVALAEYSDDVAKSKAEMLGIDRHYGDYRELLKDGQMRSVHICSPNYLHYEMAKATLEAGKHIICEKALAISVAEAEELVKLAEKMGLVNAVNFNIRYYPLMRQLRLMVVKGGTGQDRAAVWHVLDGIIERAAELVVALLSSVVLKTAEVRIPVCPFVSQQRVRHSMK